MSENQLSRNGNKIKPSKPFHPAHKSWDNRFANNFIQSQAVSHT